MEKPPPPPGSVLKIGFVGSQLGMTNSQKRRLEHLFVLASNNAEKIELHHGDSVGADEQAHTLIEDCEPQGVISDIVIHPSRISATRAKMVSDRVMEPLGIFERYRNIANATDMLVAAPRAPKRKRGGVWYTVRYAKDRGKKVVILDWLDK